MSSVEKYSITQTSLRYSNEAMKLVDKGFKSRIFCAHFWTKMIMTAIMMEYVFKLWLTDRKEEKLMLLEEEVEGQEMFGKQKIGLEQKMGGEEEEIGEEIRYDLICDQPPIYNVWLQCAVCFWWVGLWKQSLTCRKLPYQFNWLFLY